MDPWSLAGGTSFPAGQLMLEQVGLQHLASEGSMSSNPWLQMQGRWVPRTPRPYSIASGWNQHLLHLITHHTPQYHPRIPQKGLVGPNHVAFGCLRAQDDFRWFWDECPQQCPETPGFSPKCGWLLVQASWNMSWLSWGIIKINTSRMEITHTLDHTWNHQPVGLFPPAPMSGSFFHSESEGAFLSAAISSRRAVMTFMRWLGTQSKRR